MDYHVYPRATGSNMPNYQLLQTAYDQLQADTRGTALTSMRVMEIIDELSDNGPALVMQLIDMGSLQADNTFERVNATGGFSNCCLYYLNGRPSTELTALHEAVLLQ